MRPVLFTWRGRRFPTYKLMLYLGLLAGLYTSYGATRANGPHGNAVAAAILLLLVPAVLGARLAFVVGRWPLFRREPRRIIAPREGGAVAYGALLAVPVSAPLLVALHIPFGAFWDAGALGFLAATMWLRLGCLLNGCCCGRETEGRFGVVIRNAAGVRCRRVPTQLLEAGLAAALLGGAVVALGRMPFPGALFVALVTAYALGRCLLDVTREQMRTVGPVTVSQAVSAGLVLASATVFGVALLT